ncbi:MAG: ABC transporter ATP-binding protein [Acidimicrobiales bacterium]
MSALAAVECRNLSVELGGQTVLADVELQIRAGEWLGLIGPNGAGKSSLLRAIARLIDHRGDVTVASGLPPDPRTVALVPQNPVVPTGMSVTEYVMLGRTAHLGWLARESGRDRRVVVETLQRLDLAAFADRRLNALSGGELQRVVIARALVQEAPVLLLDEPTSALDVGHQTAVLELVDNLRKSDGLSVLAVMHDLTTAARFADRLALLSEGRLVTIGTPSQVLVAQRLSETYRTPLSVATVDGDLVVLPAPRSATPQITPISEGTR